LAIVSQRVSQAFRNRSTGTRGPLCQNRKYSRRAHDFRNARRKRTSDLRVSAVHALAISMPRPVFVCRDLQACPRHIGRVVGITGIAPLAWSARTAVAGILPLTEALPRQVATVLANPSGVVADLAFWAVVHQSTLPVFSSFAQKPFDPRWSSPHLVVRNERTVSVFASGL
jgi:hypothetical protein